MKRIKYLTPLLSLVLLNPGALSLIAQTTPAQGGAVIGQPNQPAAGQGMGGSQTNQANFSARTLIGAQVQNHSGQRLGTVKDLAMDFSSGRLLYLLLSDSGAAFHPVPPEAFSSSSSGTLTLDVSPTDFTHGPTLQRQQLLTTGANDAVARRIYQAYRQPWPPPGSSSTNAMAAPSATSLPTPTGQSSPPAPARGGQVSLASDLVGKPVTDPNHENVGEISDFLVDLPTGMVNAAILRTLGFVSVEQQFFAVSPKQLQLAGNQVTVNLARNNFEQAKPFADVSTMAPDLAQTPTVVYHYQPTIGAGPAMAASSLNLKEGEQATQLLNLRVNDQQGAVLGTVRDFAIDLPSGHLAYVLIASQGATVHPVPPTALTFNAQGNTLTLNVPKDRFEASPSFQGQLPQNFSQDAQIRQVYSYYNQQWAGRGSGLMPTGRPAPGMAPQTGRNVAGAGNLSLATGLIGQHLTTHELGSIGQISDLFIDLKNGTAALIVGAAAQQAAAGASR